MSEKIKETKGDFQFIFLMVLLFPLLGRHGTSTPPALFASTGATKSILRAYFTSRKKLQLRLIKNLTCARPMYQSISPPSLAVFVFRPILKISK